MRPLAKPDSQCEKICQILTHLLTVLPDLDTFWSKRFLTFLDRRTLPLDIYQWDVCNLPLRSDIVDVFISDLPFGKKSGSKHENWKLYPKALEEMARVCHVGSGRAVLLTQDKRVMGQVLNRSVQWKKDLTLWINMGGLKAGIYVLSRTKKWQLFV